ncbi:ankyrin repeat-containing domain protein, partial [Cunninghamella echinulata]
PLHYAAAYGHAQTCQALIDCGATIDIYNTIDRSTPLMLASNCGHLETVQCLVENGADPEAIDKYGRTPLHLACIQGHYDIVHYLL